MCFFKKLNFINFFIENIPLCLIIYKANKMIIVNIKQTKVYLVISFLYFIGCVLVLLEHQQAISQKLKVHACFQSHTCEHAKVEYKDLHIIMSSRLLRIRKSLWPIS